MHGRLRLVDMLVAVQDLPELFALDLKEGPWLGSSDALVLGRCLGGAVPAVVVSTALTHRRAPPCTAAHRRAPPRTAAHRRAPLRTPPSSPPPVRVLRSPGRSPVLAPLVLGAVGGELLQQR
ncbi:MAG: hypothetical protein M0Z42_07755 [Actinomycetota bacterium]|nr:hypothetical protein [Actinomycetota bacterium]